MLWMVVCCAVLSCSAVSDSLWTVACHAPLPPCPWGFSRQEYWSGLPCPPSGDLLNPGIESRSPALQMVVLPSESPGKPKNTGVGSLSLLHGNFLTQELNQGLLHCSQILYQLSYQGHLRWQMCFPNGEAQFQTVAGVWTEDMNPCLLFLFPSLSFALHISSFKSG